jgi:ribosomal protein L4
VAKLSRRWVWSGVLIVTHEFDRNLMLASRNLPSVDVTEAGRWIR